MIISPPYLIVWGYFFCSFIWAVERAFAYIFCEKAKGCRLYPYRSWINRKIESFSDSIFSIFKTTAKRCATIPTATQTPTYHASIKMQVKSHDI
jgi:hypothetical protein